MLCALLLAPFLGPTLDDYLTDTPRSVATGYLSAIGGYGRPLVTLLTTDQASPDLRRPSEVASYDWTISGVTRHGAEADVDLRLATCCRSGEGRMSLKRQDGHWRVDSAELRDETP